MATARDRRAPSWKGSWRFAGRERELDERRPIETLTAREREILQLLADGLDGPAMAARMYLSPRTQRNHVANILGKLSVHSQLQAVIFGLRHGIVLTAGAAAPAQDGARASVSLSPTR